MADGLEAAAAGPSRIPAVAADKASLTTWIAVVAGMIGAFMAILNIQITNASLLYIEGGIGTGVDNGTWISTSYLIGGYFALEPKQWQTVLKHQRSLHRRSPLRLPIRRA